MQEVMMPIKITMAPSMRTGAANRRKLSWLRAIARPIRKMTNPIIIRAMSVWFKFARYGSHQYGGHNGANKVEVVQQFPRIHHGTYRNPLYKISTKEFTAMIRNNYPGAVDLSEN